MRGILRLYTGGMSEAKAQERVLTSLKATGCKTQKFTDQFGFGIADLLAGITGLSIWIEMKYRESWPVKPTTPLLTLGSNGISGNQVFWLGEWWMRSAPTCVLLAFGDGSWLLVPGLYASRLTEMPSRAWKPLLQTTPLTRLSIHIIMKALEQSKTYLEDPANA